MRHAAILGIAILAIVGLSACEASADQGATRQSIIAAYGGEALCSMNQFTTIHDRRIAWPGQGQSIDFTNFEQDKYIKVFDFKRGRASIERWINQNGNVYHERFVQLPDRAVNIDYMTKTKAEDRDETFIGTIAPDVRTQDGLIARVLCDQDSVLISKSLGVHEGRPHEMFEFRLREDRNLRTLYVDSETHRISKVSWPSGDDTAYIVFSNYETVDGLTYATDSRSYRNGELVEYETGVILKPGTATRSDFEYEPDLNVSPDLVDREAMQVLEVGPQIYHVGIGPHYSTFVFGESGVIGFNPSEGFEARWDAIKSAHGDGIKLKFVVLSHHHSDHMLESKFAASLGAELITTDHAGDSIETSVEEYGQFSNIMRVVENTTIDGIVFKLMSTRHVNQNLVAYIPAANAVVQDDHYVAHYRSQAGPANFTGLELLKFMRDQGWAGKAILSGHSPKLEPWAQFVSAHQSLDRNNLCVSNRPICLDYIE